MSLIFVVALAAFALLAIVIMIDSVRSLWQKPVWAQKSEPQPHLQVIENVDRREQQLPFVGADRRDAGTALEQDETVELRRAA